MSRLRRLLGRTIFTAEGLARLHGRRQALNPTEGNRRTLNMLMTGGMVVLLLSALFTLMWVYRDEAAFLDAQSGVALLPNDALIWKVTAAAPLDCDKRDLFTCFHDATRFRDAYTGLDLFELDAKTLVDPGHPGDVSFVRFDTTVPHALFAAAAVDGVMVLNLPPLRFDTATVTVDGRAEGSFYSSERLAVKFPYRHDDPHDLRIRIVTALHGSQTLLLSPPKDATQVFVAQDYRFQRYLDMLAAKRTGHGKQLADIARIVLAVFSLLLFMLVDSSPESLGLALFMGFKAIGVVLNQNWLPQGALSDTASLWMQRWLLCFGDILQLYFFTQLARIAQPGLKRWFLIGGVLAAGYASVTSLGIDWGEANLNYEVWKWRNVILGLACMATALTSAAYLFQRKIYYRSAALIIAFAGTIVQVAYPLLAGFPGIVNAAWFRIAYHVLETQTPYVFALSTFINIRTLEHRVKALSKEVVAAKEIEREMTLGKTVQQSFLRVPEVPDGMGLVCVHEAALYVSGDIYFVHWDESRDVLTLVINDVTGHGVQAALKASICTTIADSIWSENQVRASDAPDSRFKTYDQRLHAFLTKVANAPEIVSLVGAEFHRASRTLALYRVGGVFPLLVEPSKHYAKADGPVWSVRVVAARNRELTSAELPRGGFVVLLSDGYIDTSRGMRSFKEHLERTLMPRDHTLTGEELREAMLEFSGFARTHDDRTLLIFRFDDPGPAALSVDRSPAA